MKKPELLSPAGDFDKLRYAIAYGADAVYLGIPRFSLRARENGFTTEMVPEAIKYAHDRGRRVYLTANIFPHNRKVEPFIKYIDQLLDLTEPDAWIMSDPGMIAHMRKQHPDQTIHLSVQANTVNYLGAKFWRDLGVKRIILSRELSLTEIARIREELPELELEAFVHGSICIAYSGRCLISSYLSRRDSNQGVCANSCRWRYGLYQKESGGEGSVGERTEADDGEDREEMIAGDYYIEESERPGEFMRIDEDEHGSYIMNARDLCTIEHLGRLADAGVDSFKIEGRSKSLYFTAVTARAYRRAIDDLAADRAFDEKNLAEILTTAGRGFHVGFLKGAPGGEAQNYDASGSSQGTRRFCGVVREYAPDSGFALFDVKGAIEIGAEVELITPEKTISFEVEALLDRKGLPTDAVHGGINGCSIKLPVAPGEFALLRKVPAAEPSSD